MHVPVLRGQKGGSSASETDVAAISALHCTIGLQLTSLPQAAHRVRRVSALFGECQPQPSPLLTHASELIDCVNGITSNSHVTEMWE